MAAPDFAAPNIGTDRLAMPRQKERSRSKPEFIHTAPIVEMLLSFVSGAAAFLLSSLASSSFAHQSVHDTCSASISLALILCFLDLQARRQDPSCGLLRIRESERALRISIQGTVILLVVVLIWNFNVPRSTYTLAFIMVPTIFLAQKHATLSALQKWRQNIGHVKRALLHGAGGSARAIVSALNDSPRLGIELAAVTEPIAVTPPNRVEMFGYRGRASLPIQTRTLTSSFLESLRPDLLVLSAANLTNEEMRAARRIAEEAGVKVGLVYDCSAEREQMATERIECTVLEHPVIRKEAWYYSTAKRITDIALSLSLLFLLSPLLLFIAFLIRFDSPGPALFVQKRVGQRGDLFSMYKFRSMYASAPKYQASPTSSLDIRITRIGKILRRTSLDELPQLINVLTGNMSLVGPRPEMPFIVDKYEANQRRRLAVVPGITGLWQLSADRAFPIHHNLEYDFYYIRNRNWFMDIAILIHTLFFAVSGGV